MRELQDNREEAKNKERGRKARESPERKITLRPVYELIECIWKKTFNLA